MGNLFAQASAYLRAHKEYRRWLALFLCLALVISAATTALLTRPGVAMTHTERVLTCPFEGEAAHTHTADCYQDGTLVCPLPERELHAHTEDCYSTEKTLTCGQEESDGHVHTEACYSLVQGELTCTDESEDHVHTDDCYAWESVLSCGMEEGEGAHRHTDDCYTETEVLICGQEELLTEHVHGPGCFTEIVVEDEEPEATEEPAVEETAEPEPSETPEVIETGDPDADLEYYWMWAETFSQLELSGDWSEDLVTVARTQLGYTESARNYIIDESGRHGYTRYGAWYGLPYDDWCAMFVAFCLNFADIPRESMPWDCVTTRWVDALTERGMFAAADSGYVPKAGDLVFFTDPEYHEPVASHVGIVAEVSEERIQSIEGNNGPAVAEFDYELSDERIYGYGILPEEEKPDPADAPEETALAVITAADGSALPEDVQPHAYPLTGREAEAAESAVEAWLSSPEAGQVNAGASLFRVNAAGRATVQSTEVSETRYEVFEIGLDNVEETAYEGGFLVHVTLPEALTGRDFALFHLGDEGVEAVEAEYAATWNANGTETVTGFSFVTESFSPFVLRYTVDFHYEGGDGTSSDFSMSGGGFLTLPELVRGLHLVRDGEEQVFLSAVANVEFSDPSLIWVGQAEADTTVGALKAELGLNSAYSADLSADEIAAFDETAVAAGEWLLISLHPFDTPETLTITLNNGSVYSIDVTDARLVSYYLSDSGELYEVSVTYGEDALIPDGATLKITEFAQDSAEYLEAREAVLADYEERGLSVDDGFGLAALDISILDADGNEIEPAAPVQVEMAIKALPGVEDVEAIADSLTVRHHIETDDGVVVQSVYHGGTKALFRMGVDEDLEPGTTAEPVSVSFPTSSFSTFTVSWGSSTETTYTAVNYLWTTAAGVNTYQFNDNGTYAGQYTLETNNLHFMDSSENGIPGYIFRTSGTETATGDLYLIYNHTGYGSGDQNISEAESTFHIYFNYNGSRYADVTVHYVDSYGNPIRRTRTNNASYNSGSVDTRYATGTNFNQTLSNYAGSKSGYTFVGVSADLPVTGTPHATIHYVDEAGNELTVSNGQPVNDTASNLNYLIYDVDGYEYAYTYRNTNTTANRITPVLRYQNSRWRYTTGTNRDGANSNTWNNLSSNDDIYVVYKPKATVPQGGTPVPKITGEKPPAPTITKESEVNEDGTNTLSLSVTGHTSVMEAEKLADVIVVFDVSGSMNDDMGGSSRMVRAKSAVNDLAEALLDKNSDPKHPELIRMSLIYFSNTATKVELSTGTEKYFTTDKTTYKDAVRDLPDPDGGTNWEYALQLANEMAVESDRATFVIFVTDGNPTFRQTRGVLNNGGTGALGDSDVSTYYFAYNVYGAGGSDNHNRNYNAALTQAQSIVNHNKNFYTIGISNDVTNLTKLTTEAGAGADHSKTATSNEELVAAFNDIATSIIATMGHSDIQITDGITDLTQTVQKSDLVSYSEDDFTYYKGHPATAEDVTAGRASAVGEMVWESWDPASENCNEAVYDSATGAVKWNMGTNFMPKEGYTYQVRFKVWPSQEAYDLLADLNNGVKSYDSLTEKEKAQITVPTNPGDPYTLKTNDETSYTYREATQSGDTVTPTGEPSEAGHFDDVDPLKLTTKPLKVQKQWHHNYVDSLVPTDQITMELYGVEQDGTTTRTFKKITLSKNTPEPWYDANNYISYGLVTLNKISNGNESAVKVKTYETGHDFTLREIDDNAHYYELSAGIYRPMVINGTTSILQLVDKPAGMSDAAFYYKNGDDEYYRLDGKVYWDTKSDIILIATNSHRSYMDFNKVVVDDDGNTAVDGTEFEYTIRFTVPAGIDNYDTVEKYIWFSIRDSVAGRTLSPDEYSYTGAQKPADVDSAYSGSAYANYLVATSGTDFTLKIKQGWNVRFLNLPIGTTYSFVEQNIPAGYNFVKAEVTGTQWIANMVNGEDLGSAQDMTSLPLNDSGDNSNTGISGMIEVANARYKTTYTNKTVTVPVKIQKLDQSNTIPLSGAVFSLYTKDGYEADPKQTTKTDLTSDGSGLFDLGKLSYGTYYLVETKAPAGYNPLTQPITITVSATGVVCDEPEFNDFVLSGKAVSEESGTYTVKVLNSSGYELPATGGVGTQGYRLGGLALAGAALAGLLRRRFRRRAKGGGRTV